jgi:hypothetical protein
MTQPKGYFEGPYMQIVSLKDTPPPPTLFLEEKVKLENLDIKERGFAKLDDLDIYQIGNEIQISGIIYSDKDFDYLCFLPEYIEGDHDMQQLDMTLEDWEKFFRQTDLVETEVFSSDSSGKLVKTVVRKTERMIDQYVTWQVFERDGYKCRYCGNSGIPLTVDHLVLWEAGGPSIEANLVTTCKKCNKTRGNTPYAEWLRSEYYQKASKKIGKYYQVLNEMTVKTLEEIPSRLHRKSR